MMSRFVISDANVFDGEQLLGQLAVHVADGRLIGLGGAPSVDEEVVDGTGATLLPGLIDAHTHADRAALKQSLTFGITTEFDLMSMPGVMVPLRTEVATSPELADVRSSSVGLTPPNGHPHQLRRGQGDPEWPTASTVAEVDRFVADRVAEGADYLKVLIEDGHALGTPVPSLDPELVEAAVRAGHARDRMVLAHALSFDATGQAIRAGADGLTHLFVDRPHSPEIVDRIVASGMFVIPTLSTLASITGVPAGADLAKDPRVRAKVQAVWLENLSGAWATLPSENFEFALATVAALHRVGVEVLAGTDASHLGAPGMAHGASLHDELRLLVTAGFTPTEALRAATAVPARRFALGDRGRIAPGRRADLLLVAGDPTTTIGDTLSVQAVWRQGIRLALEPVPVHA
jgi:imidazolonepropionase-like amidohydrolase